MGFYSNLEKSKELDLYISRLTKNMNEYNLKQVYIKCMDKIDDLDFSIEYKDIIKTEIHTKFKYFILLNSHYSSIIKTDLLEYINSVVL